MYSEKIVFLSKLMDCSNSNGRSKRLLDLAQRLRLYKPPIFPEDILDDVMEDKVVSELSYSESTTSMPQNTEEFRYKRAAVLICIFEGDAGDLRVLLTKRSSMLSTYSGQSNFIQVFCPFFSNCSLPSLALQKIRDKQL